MKYLYILAILLAFTACDEGRLYEDNTYSGNVEGRVIVLQGSLTGADSWPSKYDLVIAGFNSTSDYYVVSKDVQLSDNGTVNLTLRGIPDEVTRASLCIVNKISLLVASFVQEDFPIDLDTLHIDVTNLDVSMFNAIQENVFTTTCVQCHGGSNFAGGGLYLTQGNAYDNLVDVPATTIEDTLRVKSGDAEGSLLFNLVTLSSANNSFEETHFGMIYQDDPKITLIEDWINNLN